MIRDFWGITDKPTLKQEIDALENLIDPETWVAIDAVRQIGNIGAHMEKEVNLIIAVDAEEADLLIGLIETLFQDWYVARNNKQVRLAALRSLGEEKKAARSAVDGTAANPEEVKGNNS